MRNDQFLYRWPTGRGTGYIAYSRSLGRVTSSIGPLVLKGHKFEVVAVKVSNTTSLRDGSAEAWSTSGSLIGPLFLRVSDVFDSETEAAADINASLQSSIDSKAKAIDVLKREMEILEVNKIQQESIRVELGTVGMDDEQPAIPAAPTVALPEVAGYRWRNPLNAIYQHRQVWDPVTVAYGKVLIERRDRALQSNRYQEDEFNKAYEIEELYARPLAQIAIDTTLNPAEPGENV